MARTSTFADFKQAKAADKAIIAKEKAKMAHSKFKETCTGKTLRVANYVAVGLLILGFIFRFVYMFTDEVKGPDYSGFWFFLETIIYGLFIGLLGLSMHPNEEHPLSMLVRTQIRVLDFDFGRGAFILYLSMQMCEVVSNGEVIYALVSCLIAVVDMYLGFPDFKETLLAIGKESEEEIKDFGDVGAPQNEEELGKYNNINNDTSSNEVHLDTDADTDFSGKPKIGGDIEYNKKQEAVEDIV